MRIQLRCLDAEIDGNQYSQIIALDHDAGEFLGSVTLTHKGQRAACIQQLYVHNAARRNRVGSQLIEECRRIFEISGCETIGLLLAKGNESADAFYSLLGFVFGYQYENGDALMVQPIHRDSL